MKYQYYILILFLLFSLIPRQAYAEEDHHGEEEGHHDEHDHVEEDEHHDEIEGNRDFSKTNSWTYGLLASLVLGIVGFVCSGIVIIAKTKKLISFETITKVLIAFAAGALLGDAFIHLIPKGFGAHEHEEEASGHEEGDHEGHKEEEEKPSQELLSLMIILGLLFFFLLEKLLHYVGISHDHGVVSLQQQPKDSNNNKDLNNSKGQINIMGMKRKSTLSDSLQIQKMNSPTMKLKPQKTMDEMIHPNGLSAIEEEASNIKDSEKGIAINQKRGSEIALQDYESEKNMRGSKVFPSSQSLGGVQPTSETNLDSDFKGKKSEGYLNLVGDFFHNILDGIAMGAIFSNGIMSQAISTFVAILAHEIPQEIGDVGILLNSKFTNLQALFCNGMVNFSAMIGTIIGLLLGQYGKNTDKYLTLFIAGNFIYIGACDMIPLLNKEKNPRMFFAQLLALILGFGCMYLVLLVEDHGHEEGHEEHEEGEHEAHEQEAH